MQILAINGGKKVRTKKFPSSGTIGRQEMKAVKRVMRSGVLSKFIGAWHPDFYGGPEVQTFEQEWARYFGVKHAIAVNSATSALYCAVGAVGVNPGEEVIVSPYTMSASAVAPLIFSAIPVFADIESDYFCLDPSSIESKITERTKAIIVVDIFGQPYNVDAINAIAKKHNLFIIEDCSQAPGAKYHDQFAGTLGDIGIFSLNYHKHIHTGEGGVVVTNNDELADKIRLIRNHAESVVGPMGFKNLANMIGFNFRMTEIEAAIGREQLKKLPNLIEERIRNVEYLHAQLSKIPCLEPAIIRDGCRHVFYTHPIKFIESIAGVHRNKFVDAVKAELPFVKLRESEGVKIGSGYVKPVYLYPMFQNKITFGDSGYPWTCYRGQVDYSEGICPVAESMHEDILILHELMKPGLSRRDLDDVVSAFEKVWNNIDELRNN